MGVLDVWRTVGAQGKDGELGKRGEGNIKIKIKRKREMKKGGKK